jgi:ankyrin repeat protein
MRSADDNLFDAVEKGDSKLARELITSGAPINSTDDPFGNLKKKTVEDFRYDNSLSTFEAKTTLGRAPLHYAAWHGRLEILKQLLNAGAQVDMRDYLEFTPLLLALRGNHPDCAKELIRSFADVNAVWLKGDGPLHYAAQDNALEIQSLLLDEGANIALQNNEKWTPLDTAAFYGLTESLELLIKRFPAGKSLEMISPKVIPCAISATREIRKYFPDGESYSGSTVPLDEDLILKHVQLLLNAGADINGFGSLGKTGLHAALDSKLARVARALIDAGANVHLKTRGFGAISGGTTSLELAERRGLPDIAGLIRKHC